MTGLLQGALGSSRALLLGWFLPSAINVLLYGVLIDPRHSGFDALTADGGDAARPVLYALTGTVLLGLLLAALQTPLYRILEGYLGWPGALARRGAARLLPRKHLLENRLEAAALVARERGGVITPGEARALRLFRAHEVTGPYVERDIQRGPIWLAILEERLARYPIDDEQFAPTRLGNAIRRLEEFGYNRYRLDTQVLWHALVTAAPEPARKQADDARTGVDFFVCLLYGHLVAAVAALFELGFGGAHPAWRLGAAAGGLVAASALWYRTAVVATDEWAGAVRALVGLGREPLARGLALSLPQSLAQERDMWSLAVELDARPYSPDLARLDRYRTAAGAEPRKEPKAPPAAESAPESEPEPEIERSA